jgi:hypothetical protein
VLKESLAHIKGSKGITTFTNDTRSFLINGNLKISISFYPQDNIVYLEYFDKSSKKTARTESIIQVGKDISIIECSMVESSYADAKIDSHESKGLVDQLVESSSTDAKSDSHESKYFVDRLVDHLRELGYAFEEGV